MNELAQAIQKFMADENAADPLNGFAALLAEALSAAGWVQRDEYEAVSGFAAWKRLGGGGMFIGVSRGDPHDRPVFVRRDGG